MREFYTGWRAHLKEIDFDRLTQEGRADYVLLDNTLVHQIALLDRRDKMRAEQSPLLPFADRLLALQDARRNLANIDPRAAAQKLASVAKEVGDLRSAFEPPSGRGGGRGQTGATAGAGDNEPKGTPTVANRAANDLDQVRA